ncbi:hypothetical protein [Rhizobium mayense]|uniref:ABC transporter ATP-binding protein n=1 Tax=Rhizobium mayense TaxID=1312184 RepID=A0ABT7K6Y0_9HYPH|nr:hypothetical protein [Rhizobium mayense]MDL2402889.1 hypothetical protein [Rhizobium mayense]
MKNVRAATENLQAVIQDYLLTVLKHVKEKPRSCTTDWPGGDLIARLALTPWLGRPIREYSLGTRAKVAIGAALAGSPALLLFDKSLNGLDPVAAWEVKALLGELAASGDHGVIVSTHVVEAVPGFCNRAIFLAEGSIAESWDAAALT